MLLIGVDYHPGFQQVAFLNQDTGECGEMQLNHADGQAERFYRDLKQRGIFVRVGMEATDIPAGSSDFWQNLVSNFASVIPPRSRPSE